MSLKVIVGSACAPSLVQGMQRKLSLLTREDFQLTPCNLEKFKDGESLPQIGENIRGDDVYVVQPTNSPMENLQCMLMMLQAGSLASAWRMNGVLPYFGGLRQDRKDKPRVPITAKLNVKSVEMAMITAPQRHVMILHPHFPQVQGFFDISSSDLLYPTNIFVRKAHEITGGDFTNVVPAAADAGAAKMADIYARHLDTESLAIGDKRHDKTDHSYIRDIIGDVDGKIVMVFEDIIDSGGTMSSFVKKAREKGAKKVYVFVTHPVFAPGCFDLLSQAGIDRIYVTNSIYHESLPDLVEVIDCGALIGEAIYCNHVNSSISSISGMFFKK